LAGLAWRQSVKKPKRETTITAKPASSHQPKAIDGFVKQPSRLAAGTARSERFHRRTQRAQTLMRGGLSRPASIISQQLKRPASGPKLTTQLRAKSTPKHDRVEHFGRPRPSNPAAALPQSRTPLKGEVISSRPAHAPHPTQPLPSMVTSASHQKLERLLDEALTRADSHKQAMHYHAARHFWQPGRLGRRRWLIFGGLVITLAILLFAAWQKMPQFSMKLAGIRAHVSPAVPAYKPDGFSVAGPARAESGAVTIKYKSTLDPTQSYAITEAQSNLTSTLVSQNIVPKGTPVQTSQVDGNTVYIYGDSNDAAWVNNSVLYKIKDNAKLTSDQLINIVKGLNP
jgi:hypothetical protein